MGALDGQIKPIEWVLKTNQTRMYTSIVADRQLYAILNMW